jgi:hypothetical protein
VSRIPVIGSVGKNGNSKLLTGNIVQSKAEIYPDGMTAFQFELDGKKMIGIAAEEGRFNMDRVLRVLRLLELYTLG